MPAESSFPAAAGVGFEIFAAVKNGALSVLAFVAAVADAWTLFGIQPSCPKT